MITGSRFVSVIIPCRPGQQEVAAVSAAFRLRHPGSPPPEVLLARGRQPSVQRNAAIEQARGEFIYFLDDDALPDPGNLERGLAHFDDPSVQMVGGPGRCPAKAPFCEQIFAVVLGSWLAFGPSRARYESVGRIRASSEKELILCNLIARRDAVLAAGGFDETLYPNEENALMDRLQEQGGVLIYDPDVFVERRPRPTLRAFSRMVFNYGRGRAEQFRSHPTAGSLANLVPPLFCLYLVSLPFLGSIGMAPLIPYWIALLAQGVFSTVRHGFLRSLLSLPLVVLTHIGYGIGFWKGLFTSHTSRARVSRTEIVIERPRMPAGCDDLPASPDFS